jgi:hypothetical protein
MRATTAQPQGFGASHTLLAPNARSHQPQGRSHPGTMRGLGERGPAAKGAPRDEEESPPWGLGHATDPKGAVARCYMWITRPNASSTLSCIVSDSVGCGKTVCIRSSSVVSSCMAMTKPWISSVTSAPTIWAPSS